MDRTAQRRRLRAVLAGPACIMPASVYDPVSARVAEIVGYEIGLVTGNITALSALAAPDLALITLTELADQIRRIMRVCNLSLIADGEHGYGNALNVRRTIEELEHAGVSGLKIEDTVLPRRYGNPEGEEVVSTEEMAGKLRAAVAARQDAEMVIAGRVSFRAQDLASTVERVKAYAATGIDALFLVGLQRLDQIEAVHEAVRLPLMLGPAAMDLQPDDLAARGARVLFRGHHLPGAASIGALLQAYSHLFSGGAPGSFPAKVASAEDLDRITGRQQYGRWGKDFLS